MSRRQLPRTTAAILDAATFLPGEIAVDTTNDELRYDGDGSTVGGIKVARKDGVGTSVTSTGSTTARTLAARFADVGNVMDFGAVDSVTTSSTAAFTAAFAEYDCVYAPPGTYRIEGLIIPDGKKLYGAGRGATKLRAGAACSYVVRVGQHSILESIEINGNLVATSGVEVNAKDFAQIRFVNVQYCTRGYYFTSADVVTMLNTASDNNTYGIYVDERFINCAIIRHVSNGDGYGYYNTYTTQQSQGVSFSDCMFISNTNAGYYFVKDAFSISITDCIVDLCGGTAIYLGAAAIGTAADIAIQRGFFYGSSYSLRIFPCWQHISIHGATIAGTQTTSVVLISATTTTRCEQISFVDCRIGSNNASGKGIDADSVNGLDIEGCDFTAAGSTTDIALSTTYTSAANPLPRIIGNIFRKGGDPITGSAVVDANIGYTTRENITVQETTFGGTGFALLRGADIASATTTDIGAATGPSLTITGTTTITGFGTIAAGHRRTVKFSGALTLTHNGTSLILPGSANITTAADDTAEFESLGSGNWICNWYKRASGLVLSSALATAAQSRDTTNTTHALTPANLLNAGVARVLWYLTGANFNDNSNSQQLTKNGTFTNWMLGQNGSVRVVNPSAAASSAVGGIYTATAKGGTAIVANSQAWSSLTGTGVGQAVTGTADGIGLRSDGALYFHLDTAHGSAVTADIYIIGIPLS